MILTVQIFLKILSLSYLWALNKCLMGVLLIPLPAGARHSSHGEPEGYFEEVLLRSSKLRKERECESRHPKRTCSIPTPIHSTTFIECLLCAQFEHWHLIHFRIWCTFEGCAVNSWSLKGCLYRINCLVPSWNLFKMSNATFRKSILISPRHLELKQCKFKLSYIKWLIAVNGVLA